MKPLAAVMLVVAVAVSVAIPSPAAAGPAGRGEVAARRVPEVARGWPLHRSLYPVLIRPTRVPIRVHATSFLPPVVWKEAVEEALPPPETVAWEGHTSLALEDGWTEVTLVCRDRGSELHLDVSEGRTQIDWVEIVFVDGRAQVVDFRQRTLRPAVYRPIRFHQDRGVDHLRLVARALDKTTRIELDLR